MNIACGTQEPMRANLPGVNLIKIREMKNFGSAGGVQETSFDAELWQQTVGRNGCALGCQYAKLGRHQNHHPRLQAPIYLLLLAALVLTVTASSRTGNWHEPGRNRHGEQHNPNGAAGHEKHGEMTLPTWVALRMHACSACRHTCSLCERRQLFKHT